MHLYRWIKAKYYVAQMSNYSVESFKDLQS